MRRERYPPYPLYSSPKVSCLEGLGPKKSWVGLETWDVKDGGRIWIRGWRWRSCAGARRFCLLDLIVVGGVNGWTVEKVGVTLKFVRVAGEEADHRDHRARESTESWVGRDAWSIAVV